jgi:hypothetical protein
MPRKKQNKRPRLQRVSISVEKHDDPDWDRFAWALLQYSKIVSARKTAPKQPKRKRQP